VRTIGIVTVGRSDYGIYRPVLRTIMSRSDVEAALFVAGAHFAERFGRTVEEIEQDGFPIAARVESFADDDTQLAVATSLGRAVSAFAAAFARSRPDILVVLGDRYEMLAAGIASLPLTIPLAHIHGGESTQGAIDESCRHCLTKLSHLHFAATQTYAQRIIQLGEEPWRVMVSGSPALDEIATFVSLTDDELSAEGLKLRGPTLLVTVHPETLDLGRTEQNVDAVLAAISESGLAAVFTYPNADASHRIVIDRIESAVAANDRFQIVRNLGTQAYYTLMSRAVTMVGNSSSGIIEAASFRLPVVDVGSRQQGRLMPANVIHVESEAASIGAAIRRACSAEFRQGLDGLVNPYGDGNAAERIAERLAAVPLDRRLLTKHFYDLEGVNR